MLAGFAQMGSPSAQRMLEGDRRRVEAIRALAHDLRTMAELPPSLADVGPRGQDPVTGQPLEYRKLGPTTYQLCVNFEAAAAQEPARYRYGRLAQHGAGRQCFTLDTRRPEP